MLAAFTLTAEPQDCSHYHLMGGVGQRGRSKFLSLFGVVMLAENRMGMSYGNESRPLSAATP
jgi:hypothetical protein